MSKLSNGTKLSMLWTRSDFQIQVYLFMELPLMRILKKYLYKISVLQPAILLK